jgi:glycosyltransferase involved in cell wall biosynthesis
VLFFEDTVPLRRLGSGFVRANDIVRAIAAAGCEVSVFPVNGAPFDIMSLFGDLPDSVEILHDLNINRLEGFLRDRQGFYDLTWISRTHNFSRLQPIFEAAGVTPQSLPVVLDTEAVVTMREAARALLTGQAKVFDAESALRREFAGAETAKKILGVSRWETGLIAALGLPASLLGTSRGPAPTAAPFGARSGLLFVGAIHRPDSPNLDSLAWYAQEILPALADEMDDPPMLNVCGYVAPSVDLSAFRNIAGIKIHGAADDLSDFYETNRVFIAPTRFAAGTPYKIYEAAAHGLPCVTTELLARQLDWVSGTDLLTAPAHDARRFAAQIAMLYRTEAVWTKLRSNAAAKLAAENSADIFEARVADILASALGK